MAARLGSLLALAASLAQTGAEESKPVVIVDHITSSVYLDDRRRSKGKVGGPPLRAKAPVPLVLGLTGSAIACGAICDFVVKQRRLPQQDGAAEEVWEVPVETEDSGQKGTAAVTRLKVSIAILVGLVVSTAARRAVRKRPVRGVVTAAAAPERPEANDLGSIKLKKKVSVASREIKWPEDTQEIQFAGNDEPHPELEPGRAGESDEETPNHKDEESEDDLSAGLQPGNKGYVHKRKSEYEAKESRTNSSGDLLMSQRSSMRELERSKRRTEYHRISTEHHLANLVGLVGVDDDDDSTSSRRKPEFHRMNTEPQTPNPEEEKEEREESVDSFVEFERRNNTANKDVGFYRIHTPQVDSKTSQVDTKTSFFRISTEG